MNEIAVRGLAGQPVAATLLSPPDEAETLSGLIGAIYDAAIETSRWPAVLAATRDYVGGMAANLYAKRSSGLARGVYHEDGGITAHFKQLYTERYVSLDPATAGELCAELEQTVSTIDIADYDEYLQTRFYLEWQRPQGMVDFICAPIEKSGDRTALFCIFRHERDGLIDERARRRMRAIVPHVRRAVLISQVVEQRTSQAASFREVLDGLAAGLFFVDPHNRIVHANRTGEDMLGNGDAILSQHGRLATVERPATKLLAEAAEAAGSGDEGVGIKGISVPIEARAGDRFAAHVLPLTRGSRRQMGSAFSATAAVFVQRATLSSPTAAQLIARTFNLTPSEQRVLIGVVEVGGVPETANALGVAESTVKTHLQRVFEKTGVTRQADLVKLVAGYASPLSN